MDLFLKFLILGGKYLSQLTAQSIVEAYRRSIQLGRTLNVHAQHAVAVVSHYDSMLEMYQRNLDEFQTLPNAHLAFISEQHRQEFESYMLEVGLVTDEEINALFRQGVASTDGDGVDAYVHQMAQSILGAKHAPIASISTPCQKNDEQSGEQYDSDVDHVPVVPVAVADRADHAEHNLPHVTLSSSAHLTCLSPLMSNPMDIFKEPETDTKVNTVAEYLDRQADYIKCANDTFKHLQVDIANKYALIQQQVQEVEVQREKAFTDRLKAVQKEVETCTKLMKQAQDHFDVHEEDKKTKRLFGSIDKIINDVEAITRLMETNEEHFMECENIKFMKEKGSPDPDHTQLMDANNSAYHKFICGMVGQQLKQHTPSNNLRVFSTAATSCIAPIDCHILGFLNKNKSTNIEHEKMLEVNQKAFEQTESTMKFPLIGRWHNQLKRSRKSTNLSKVKKSHNLKKKRNKKTSLKKLYRFSKAPNLRSKFSGQPLHRNSTDESIRNRLFALSSTWIRNTYDLETTLGDKLVGPPEVEHMPCIQINSAINRYLQRTSQSEYSAAAPGQDILLVVDEQLDYLVEQMLSISDGAVPCEATDELKMKAISEIKTEIGKNLKNVRELRTPDAKDPVSFNLKPIKDYSAMEKKARGSNALGYTQPAMPNTTLMYDGEPVEVPSAQCTAQPKHNQARETEIEELEAARRTRVEKEELEAARRAKLEREKFEAVKKAEVAKKANAAKRAEAAKKAEVAKKAKAEAEKIEAARKSAADLKELEEAKRAKAEIEKIEEARVAKAEAGKVADAIKAKAEAEKVEAAKRAELEELQEAKRAKADIEKVEAARKAKEVEGYETARRAKSEDNARQRSLEEAKRVEVANEARRIEAKRAIEIGNAARIKAMQDAAKIAAKENCEAEKTMSFRSRCSHLGKNIAFQLEALHPDIPAAEVDVTTPESDLLIVCTKNSYVPLEIGIPCPEFETDLAQVSLHISVVPSAEKIPSLKDQPQFDTDINATLLMKDIVRELEEKNTILEWQHNNTLLQLACEMNEAAAIKKNISDQKIEADHHLKEIFNLESLSTGENPEVLVADTTDKSSLELVEDFDEDPLSNVHLAEVWQSPEQKKVFGGKWKNWKKMHSKPRKACKSYTVVKTKTNEITLIDMINRGSRILDNPRDKLTGTRTISFNKSADNVLKRLKPSTACTVLRKQDHSKDIKLIPMNVLQTGRADSPDSPARKERNKAEKNTANQYRVETAKAFSKPATSQTRINTSQPNIPPKAKTLPSFRKEQEEPEQKKPDSPPVQMKKVIEAASNRIVPKQQAHQEAKFLELPSKSQLRVDKLVEPQKEAKVSPNQTFNRIYDMRKVQSRNLERVPSSTMTRPGTPQKTEIYPLNRSQMKKMMAKDAKEKTSLNASVDGDRQDAKSTSSKKEAHKKAGTIVRPGPDVPVIELKRFQSPAELKCAPSSYKLMEDAKQRKPERMEDLRIKVPSETDTVTVRTKSDETLRTIDSVDVEDHSKPDLEQTPKAQVTPNYIIDEEVVSTSKSTKSCGSEHSQQFERPSPHENVCDYDVQYKHDAPEIREQRVMSKPINPKIKEAIERYHNVNNECSVKSSTYGNKILTDTAAVPKKLARSDPPLPPPETNRDVSDCIKFGDENEKTEMVSDADKKGRLKPFQTRNQSSTSLNHMAPHSSHTKMPPLPLVLPDLPKLENIAVQLGDEPEPLMKIEASAEKDDGILDVKGLMSTGHLAVCVEEPAKPMEARVAERAPPLPSQKILDNYMAAPVLPSLDIVNAAVDPQDIKVELLDPHTEEKVTYNFSTGPGQPSCADTKPAEQAPLQYQEKPSSKERSAYTSNIPRPTHHYMKQAETQLKAVRSSSKITYPIPQAWKKSFSPKARVDSKSSLHSHLKDALRSTRVQMKDPDTHSIKKFNTLHKPHLRSNRTDSQPSRQRITYPNTKIAMKGIANAFSSKPVDLDIKPTTTKMEVTQTKKTEDDASPLTISIKVSSSRPPSPLLEVESTPSADNIRVPKVVVQGEEVNGQERFSRPSSPGKGQTMVEITKRIKPTKVTSVEDITTINIDAQKPQKAASEETEEPLSTQPDHPGAKTFEDMDIANDMILSGANLQYLNQLNAELRNPAYNKLLEKCFPKDKQQSDDVRTVNSLMKLHALLQSPSPAQIEKKPPHQSKIPFKMQSKPKPQQEQQAAQEVPPTRPPTPQQHETFLVKAQSSSCSRPDGVKQTFADSKESFIIVDGLNGSTQPVVRTFGKRVLENLDKRSKEFEKPTRQTSAITIEPKLKDALHTAVAQGVASSKPRKTDESMPEYLQVKGSERERNLKRLIILEEKIKKLEAKRARKADKEVAPFETTLVSVLEEMRCKKSSKFPEQTYKGFSPKINSFKENSNATMGSLYRKSYSNTHSPLETSRASKSGNGKGPEGKQGKAEKKAEPVPAKGKAERKEKRDKKAKQADEAVLAFRACAKAAPMSNSKKNFALNEVELIPIPLDRMEEFIKIRKLNTKEMKKSVNAPVWAPSISQSPPENQVKDKKPKVASVWAGTSQSHSTDECVIQEQSKKTKMSPLWSSTTTQSPSSDDHAQEQYNLPLARRKNMLPKIPELKGVDVVVPRKVVLSKPVPKGPPTPKVADPVTISPPPFRIRRKYITPHDLYTDDKYFQASEAEVKAEAVKEMAENDELVVPLPPMKIVEPVPDSKVYMPYAAKEQRPVDTEEPVKKCTQFDERRTRHLKLIQNKIKEAMREMEEKEKEHMEHERTFMFTKKAINPYTNTFGRHLARLMAESETKNKRTRTAEEYEKNLAKKLQRLSSLPRVKEEANRTEAPGFVYHPPEDKGGIRDAKRPSLSEMKRTIMRHLRAAGSSDGMPMMERSTN